MPLKALNAKLWYKNLKKMDSKSLKAFYMKIVFLQTFGRTSKWEFLHRKIVYLEISHPRNTVMNWIELGKWSWTSLRKPYETGKLRKIRQTSVRMATYVSKMYRT